MDPSVYELLKILKFMSDQKYKGEKISKLTLIDFCDKMLATPISSITFAAMYDACYRYKNEVACRKNFYQLSRDIDEKIVNDISLDIRFKKYDNRFNKILGSKNNIYNELYKKYTSKSCNIFNFDMLEKYEILDSKEQEQIPQKFNISNLVV